MAKILRNESGADLDIPDINFFAIADTDSVTLDPRQYDKASKSALDGDLSTLIASGDVVINDGNDDLSASVGLEYMLGPESALGERFLSDPERVNGFTAKNTQEAIEEAKNEQCFSFSEFSCGFLPFQDDFGGLDGGDLSDLSLYNTRANGGLIDEL